MKKGSSQDLVLNYPNRITESGDFRVTEDGYFRIVQSAGIPIGDGEEDHPVPVGLQRVTEDNVKRVTEEGSKRYTENN